eukprot:8825567-Alexandrium_andersonii.AAC.1
MAGQDTEGAVLRAVAREDALNLGFLTGEHTLEELEAETFAREAQAAAARLAIAARRIRALVEIEA